MQNCSNLLGGPLKKLAFTLVCIFVYSLGALAKDFNGLGFQAYQKKNYKQALEHFSAATQKDSKNAFAWLNYGRTIVALNGKSEPDDYCEFASNWKYQALDFLTKATDLDFKKVFPKLNATEEPLFKQFIKSPEYKKWLVAIQPLPKKDNEISLFLTNHSDWLIETPGQVPSQATFKSDGTVVIETKTPESSDKWQWKVMRGKVQLSKKDTKRNFGLESILWYFAEGSKSLKTLVLKESNTNEQWTLGPMTADCQ